MGLLDLTSGEDVSHVFEYGGNDFDLSAEKLASIDLDIEPIMRVEIDTKLLPVAESIDERAQHTHARRTLEEREENNLSISSQDKLLTDEDIESVTARDDPEDHSDDE